MEHVCVLFFSSVKKNNGYGYKTGIRYLMWLYGWLMPQQHTNRSEEMDV